jgi:hypothetical protein
MQQWWFIDTQYRQYFLNMFRVRVPRNSEHISPPSSPEPSQLQPELSTIGSNTQHDLPS